MRATLCTLNLNGIRSAGRRGFARWLARAKPDILCLQELRAVPEDVEDELRAPAGYSTRWRPALKKGYSGVACYVRESPDAWRADEAAWPTGVTLARCPGEGRVLRADWHDLSVLSVYVPSGSSSPERQRAKFAFLEGLERCLAALLAEGRAVAVTGDLNIAPTALDLARPKANEKNSGFLPEERAWFARQLERGWVDVVREQHPGRANLYSWWSNRGRAREKDIGWRLDHVLASPAFAARVRGAWIEPRAGLSDHAPVFVEFER